MSVTRMNAMLKPSKEQVAQEEAKSMEEPVLAPKTIAKFELTADVAVLHQMLLDRQDGKISYAEQARSMAQYFSENSKPKKLNSVSEKDISTPAMRRQSSF